MAQPPPIDSRTTADITKQVQELLLKYAPDWPDRQPTGISAALIGVFARYAEIIIQRLNKAPYKNFLAFLDLLGASLLPPQPARVPLLFSLAAGSDVDAIVPAGTQVAAAPVAGETEPVIFETERDLVVTAAQLQRVFVCDPQNDKYGYYSDITKYNSDITKDEVLSYVPAFQGKDLIDHIFYIGSDNLLSYSDLQTLTLTFSLEQNLNNSDSRSVQWEIWNELQLIPIPSSSIRDQTDNLTRSGTIVFSNLAQVPQTTVNSYKSRWLICQLLTPITQLRQLPSITSITLDATLGNTEQPIEQAFTNLLPQDLSKPFFPFGEKPQFGDTLYLANREAFSKSGATVTLHVDLADLAAVGIPVPNTNQQPTATLEWEVWTAQGWISVGTSTPTGPTAPLSPPQVMFRDTTQAFTVPGSDKVIEFILPANLETITVNGIESFWLRVRIKSGNYGEEATYQQDQASKGYTFVPASFKPPLIISVKVDYTLTISQQQPDKIITYNNFSYQDSSSNSSFIPFKGDADSQPTLYLGFSIPENRNSFPNRTLSIYFQVEDAVYKPQPSKDKRKSETENPSSSSSSLPPRLVWEYWSGKIKNWEKLTVRDETKAFALSEVVELLPPADFDKKQKFNLEKPFYWLRVYRAPKSGEYSVYPKLKRVLINTTTALQTVTISNEIVGSSDGTKNQKFRTTRSPVLEGEYLEVREPEIPSAQERESIEKVFKENAISVITDISERPQEIWVRWQEVPDFYGSGSRDRHYVLDKITGEISFGDGLNGLIPPIGIGNLRLTRYQTGGGTGGNRPANTIVQLKTTVPYVDKVTNPEPATGGADAETIESLTERSPRTVRHSMRAVTFEDYEDLAMLATPEVARAKCVPLLNLHANPLDTNQPNQSPKAPGEVSVIVVPRSPDKKPLPSLDLLARVQDYLQSHAIATTKIWVVGPLYVEVSVTADIALTSLDRASTVAQAVNKTLTDFLHPLTGGLERNGWAFGREPYKSDFYALLEAVPGVDHVRRLNVQEIEEQDGVKKTARFLVYSGTHTINLLFEEV